MDSGWSLWKGDAVVTSEQGLGELIKRRRDVIVAVPAAYCTTFSLALPTQDESVFEDMVFAQIEKRGLAESAGRSVPFDYYVVEKKGAGVLLSVDVLSSKLPDAWCVSAAAAFFPSARLLRPPVEHNIMIWSEHGRLVMAAIVHGRVSGAIQLSASDKLDTALAQEVNLLCLSLQADGSIGESSRLVVLGDFARGEGVDFGKNLMMPVEYCSPAVAGVEAEASEHMGKLLPLPVREGHRAKQKSHKRNAVIMALGVLYVVVGAALWIFSQRTEKNIANLEKEVEANRPEVRGIEEAASRWQELTPAFDFKRFPLVQLNEVTRLMPPSGVVIREFETKGSSVRIRGQARDAQIAFQFEEDLKSSKLMGQYQWNMPQPKVGKNNAASFEIQGELNYATSE